MLRNLIWLVYTIITGCLGVGVTSLLCVKGGLNAYWGIFFVALYAMFAAGGISILCQGMSAIMPFVQKNRSLFVVLEATLAVTFVVVGLLFRMEGVASANQGTIYYDMAKMTMGQDIPLVVHGAVYLYLQMLHGAFAIFGNHFAVGIWIQIILQMAALMIVFFTIRKLAGAMAALVSLGFGMCAPYMVGNSLMLSPEMLYFFLLAAAVSLIIKVYSRNLKPLLFLPMGAMIALFCYLDVSGLLLLIPAFVMISCCHETTKSVQKVKAVIFILVGVCFGFFFCILGDAFFSGASLMKVAGAWFQLYHPEGVRVPVVVEAQGVGSSNIVLLGFMIFGIFSFWQNPEQERMTICVLTAGVIILTASFGIFTNEMSGSFILYVTFIVLAGVGVGQCFTLRPGQSVKADELLGEEWDSMEEKHTMAEKLFPEEDSKKEDSTEKVQSGKEMPSQEITNFSVENFEEKDSKENSQSGEMLAGVITASNAIIPNERKKRSKKKEVGKMREIILDFDDEKAVKYIQNPLPLPKKHVKRVLEYSKDISYADEDFDHDITAGDDYDI